MNPTHRAAETTVIIGGGECGREINKMIPGAAKADGVRECVMVTAFPRMMAAIRPISYPRRDSSPSRWLFERSGGGESNKMIPGWLKGKSDVKVEPIRKYGRRISTRPISYPRRSCRRLRRGVLSNTTRKGVILDPSALLSEYQPANRLRN
jgi:hypothetical protein